MVSSLNTRARLMDMQSQHHGNDPVETQGTVFMADCVRKFCLVFFSKKLSNVERVETASDCLNSIRYWRKHVHHSSSLNLKDNFITKQTWTMSAYSCTLQFCSSKHMPSFALHNGVRWTKLVLMETRSRSVRWAGLASSQLTLATLACFKGNRLWGIATFSQSGTWTTMFHWSLGKNTANASKLYLCSQVGLLSARAHHPRNAIYVDPHLKVPTQVP